MEKRDRRQPAGFRSRRHPRWSGGDTTLTVVLPFVRNRFVVLRPTTKCARLHHPRRSVDSDRPDGRPRPGVAGAVVGPDPPRQGRARQRARCIRHGAHGLADGERRGERRRVVDLDRVGRGAGHRRPAERHWMSGPANTASPPAASWLRTATRRGGTGRARGYGNRRMSRPRPRCRSTRRSSRTSPTFQPGPCPPWRAR